jgi:4a-hydroxytetrahydrobiopterin dehydratase
MSLLDEKAQKIQAGMEPLSTDEASKLMEEIPGWTLNDGSIDRTFTFQDFNQALEFTNRVAAVAAAEDHHPDICIHYNRVELVFSTHKIGGLSRNDFIVAAKINRIAGAA